MKDLFKKYGFYLFRWQLSSPILALVTVWLVGQNAWVVAIIANLIGGLMFFWVDKFIFRPRRADYIYWEISEGLCHDCSAYGEVRRVVLNKRYDRQFANKEFRCAYCADKKLNN